MARPRSSFTSLRLRRGVATVLAPLFVGLVAPLVAAGGLDLSVSAIGVNQGFQNGSTTLVAGRSTFVRATIQVDGSAGSVPGVDALMRVFVDGAEWAGSPVYSTNGPLNLPLAPSLTAINHTLNFVFLPPESADVELIIEVNPAGPHFVAEANTANNTGTTGSLAFEHRKIAELAYAPVDLDPSGGSNPNPPDSSLIEPGVGDNFVQGIYPSKDWLYHRIDAPTKLWTGSVASSSGGQVLLNSLVVDANLMSPVPAYIYGWVPGGISYNGTSQINGIASMGNTETTRHQRTFAHELGHCFGLFHNGFQSGFVNVDVEHHLNLTQSLPQIKPTNLNDIMVAGLLTHQAWVAASSYNHFLNHGTFNDSAATAGPDGETRLLVAGLWNRETGAMEVTDALTFEGGRSTVPVEAGAANLRVDAFAEGTLVRRVPLEVEASGDCSSTDSNEAQPTVGFNAVLPARIEGRLVDRVEVTSLAAGTPALILERSAAAPSAHFVAPTPAGLVTSGRVTVAWEASDADGDALTYYLTYRPDGQARVPVASSLTTTQVSVDLDDMPALVDGRGRFELLVSDGLNTTVVQSLPLFAGPEAATLGTNPPWIQILTPDNTTRVVEGATVILHSSGWDLEDRALYGESIEWSSNLVGSLGTGRLLSVADLSPGTHTITAQATDSGDLTASDSAIVIVTGRDLPFVDGTICQADIGFDGPGDSVLSVCGEDLSDGTTATLLLTGAVPNQPAWILAGLTFDPTPLFGGTIVPLPATIVVSTATNGDGELVAPGVPGGNGPFSLYVQVLHEDGAQPLGYGISNAVRIDFLP